jgi:hypothetical protein
MDLSGTRQATACWMCYWAQASSGPPHEMLGARRRRREPIDAPVGGHARMWEEFVEEGGGLTRAAENARWAPPFMPVDRLLPSGAHAIVLLVPVNGAQRIDLRHRELGGGPLATELQ